MRWMVVVVGVLVWAVAFADPTVSASLETDPLEVGLVAPLTVQVEPDGPLQDLGFTVSLPAGLAVAEPSGLSWSCDGTAELQGASVVVSRARTASPCTLEVWLTGISPGQHDLLVDDIAWDGGSLDAVVASLGVETGRGTLDARFEPAAVPLGETARVVFDLSLPEQFASYNLSFELPDGAQAVRHGGTCAMSVTGGTVSAFGTFFTADGSCEGWVEFVPSQSADLLVGPLSKSGAVPAAELGSDIAELTVDAGPIRAVVEGDPVAPGGAPTLQVTLTNLDRRDAATDIAWTLDLDAALSGLQATSLPEAPCGAGSSLTGTSLLTLTGGSLPAGGAQCGFEVPLQVPAGATPGRYDGLTGQATLDLGGSAASWDPAPWVLRVEPLVDLAMTHLDAPATPGGEARVEYTLDNLSATSAATDLSFEQSLPGFPPSGGSTLPDDVCGPDSSAMLIPPTSAQPGRLVVSGGSLAPGSTCTFEVAHAVPRGMPTGTYPLPTGQLTGTLGGEPLVAQGATVDVEVVAAPRLALQVAGGDPGETVDLAVSLSLGENAPGDATSIGFTLDLSAALGGLVAVGTPMADVCGAGSSLTGTSTLALSQGSLTPLGSCSFTVPVQIPQSATHGVYQLVSSEVSATVDGVATTARSASASLVVGPDLPRLEMGYDEAQVLPGGEVVATWTLRNPTDGELSFFLVDDLSEPYDAAAWGDPAAGAWCGAGSTVDTTGAELQASGTLAPGAECTLSAPFDVGTRTGEFAHQASASWSDGPSSTAAAQLVILPPLTWEATGTEALPGQVVPVTITIANAPDAPTAEGLAFTIDLEAALSGLVANNLPQADVCGAGSSLTGTSTVSLEGGALAPGADCTMLLFLEVPAGAAAPGSVSIATSELTSSTSVRPGRVIPLDLGRCASGYEPSTTPGACANVDECADGLDDCVGHATCVDTDGSFDCVCGDGFTGPPDACEDIDECAEETDDCPARATCVNTTGSVTCECPEGTRDPDCTAICGDGLVVFEEGCDDGGLLPGDGCDDRCMVEEGWACEGEPSVCAETCGDGIVDPWEACDDGNLAPFDGCAPTCVVEAGWVCSGEPSECEPSCGDGLLEEAEACDDGNLAPGDGCDATCAVEEGWVCEGEPSVCEELCGNGVLDGQEQCDDGAANHPEGPCTPECELVDVEGCGCSSPGSASLVLWLLPLALLRRRRAGHDGDPRVAGSP